MNSIRTFRGIGLSAITLCLTATFGFSVAGPRTIDRATRTPARTRANRNPRLRVSAGVSHCPYAVQCAFAGSMTFAAPPVPESNQAGAVPNFEIVELLVPMPDTRPVSVELPPSSLSRPPPVVA